MPRTVVAVRIFVSHLGGSLLSSSLTTLVEYKSHASGIDLLNHFNTYLPNFHHNHCLVKDNLTLPLLEGKPLWT